MTLEERLVEINLENKVKDVKKVISFIKTKHPRLNFNKVYIRPIRGINLELFKLSLYEENLPEVDGLEVSFYSRLFTYCFKSGTLKSYSTTNNDDKVNYGKI